jgi:potassium/sodium efflux P-type ATPase
MSDTVATSQKVHPAALDPEEVLRGRGVSAGVGLSRQEAEKRLQKYGRNVLESSGGESIPRILWRQINDPLIWVLIASGLLAIALGETIDAIVVYAVVVANTLIGFAQEYKAGKEIEALASFVPTETVVLRDGERQTVPASEVVPGDVLLLQSGDRVPADGRVLRSRGLQTDESALTGESLPVQKDSEPVEPDAGVADRTSMVHNGSYVTGGAGTAVVTATGRETELGRVSTMLDEAEGVETPLTRQISAVGKWIASAILAVAAVLLVLGLARGFPLVDAVLAAIALAVAAIPEGLPAVITITLAIGVRHMARRQAVIRHLPAAETLGSSTVICSDKTGTLTRNEMTVRRLWTASGEVYAVGGTGYRPDGEVLKDDSPVEEPPDDLRELLLAGVLCNDSGLKEEDGEWRVAGDPTEGALLVAARKLGLTAEGANAERPRRDSVPFESERQYMATLNGPDDGERFVYLKGAPEVVLERCGSLAGGRELDRQAVLGVMEGLAKEGQRVLAFACREAGGAEELDEDDLNGGFQFLGLAGMIDPPRDEAIEAVAACHRAGIAVKMITGDHAATATAIGRQLGLVDERGALTGREISRLSDEELNEAVAATNVFARVAPEHKLRILKTLQSRGEVAAMTGDGVNDAPALKQADIGVAMGITGTDVSKEAADVVLTDDNFSSIEAAIEEGRRVYDNLRKALAFLLPTNIGQALIILVGVMFFPVVGGETLLPMQPTQVLWVNLVVAVALALPLAFEVLEPGTMERPPRDPNASILDSMIVLRTLMVGALMAAGGVGLFLFEYAVRGGGLAEAQTMAVTAVIFYQVFYLIECRSLRGSVFEVGLLTNKWVFVGIGALLLLQLGFVYLPFMNTLFHTAPLGLAEWLLAALVGLVVFPFVGVEKWVRRRRKKRSGVAATPRRSG